MPELLRVIAAEGAIGREGVVTPPKAGAGLATPLRAGMARSGDAKAPTRVEVEGGKLLRGGQKPLTAAAFMVGSSMKWGGAPGAMEIME